MNRVGKKKHASRALLLALALALVGARGAAGFSLWPSSLPKPPSLYLIEGYLDRAPAGAVVSDRIELAAHGRTRTLLVTSYRTPGETTLDRYLSRSMMKTYSLRGANEEVHRLIDAPAGLKIRGTFAAYTDGPPSLLIADLSLPQKN